MRVAEILRELPHFDSFCSVGTLQALAEDLRRDTATCTVAVAGLSRNGLPIHHIRCGRGSLKALFVGFPHCDEPIGGLTTYGLITLLRQRNHELAAADVEWHIVPCIDPDGARLNEGWTQTAFTLESFLRNFHKQELADQADCSFPIRHKRLVFDAPTPEAAVLQRLLTDIRPDFYYPLHNAWAGGAFFFFSRVLDLSCYDELCGLLAGHAIALQTSAPHRVWCDSFAPGLYEIVTTRKIYDTLEKTTPHPEKVFKSGACSWEYLAQIKPDAFTLVTELPYVRHPSDGSQAPSALSMRQLKLRIDADNKFLATVILEEWAKVEQDLDATSPFYRKIFAGVIASKDGLAEGLPSWGRKTRDVLFNPAYGQPMTEGERFNTYLFDRFYVLCHCHEFVRLLKGSGQTAMVRQSIARMEKVFDAALCELRQNIAMDRFEIVSLDALARVQLGSGLIVLNALLDARRKSGDSPEG
jgi:hypothetical protein